MKSRRNFLKLAGVGFTGSLLRPVNTSASNTIVGKRSLKIGVLLPQSNEHPGYSGSFMDGLKLGLNHVETIENCNIELVTEHVNYGFPFISRKKVKQLITENNVDMVVGLLNSDVSVDFGEFVEQKQVPTLIANTGENHLTQKAKKNPYLFFNSLNLFQNSYVAGKYAVEKYGKNIAVVTSLYDCGYDALIAFYKGVESAGGTIVETYVNKQNKDDFIDKTIDNLENEEIDGIYVFLNGNLADDFFRTAHQRKMTIPILTTSFASEDHRLINIGNAALGIQSFSAWSKELKNNENQTFVSNYNKQYSKDPDQFGFLGYESGILISDSFVKCQSNFSGNKLAEAFRSCKIKSPGGDISINANSGLVNNPVYLCKIEASTFSVPQNSIEKEFVSVSEFDDVFVSLDKDLRSGWFNPYLFV